MVAGEDSQNTSVVRELIPAFVYVTMACSGSRAECSTDTWRHLGRIFPARADAKYKVPRRVWRVQSFTTIAIPTTMPDDLRFEYWGLILTDHEAFASSPQFVQAEEP